MDICPPIDPDAQPDEADNRGRAFRMSLPRYFVSRYPVTVRQWDIFVRAVESGAWVAHAPDGRDLAVTAIDLDPPRPWERPVALVSWEGASAYCAWLTARLRAHQETPTKLARLLREGDATCGGRPWVITLPSEAEWEQAARGRTDVRRYPWGDNPDANRANGLWNVPQEGLLLVDRSAVGAFPGGTSPWGAEEVCGNVREWTRSLHGPYPYPRDAAERYAWERPDAQGTVCRVVRGGSCDSSPRSLRVANRVHTGWLDFRDFDLFGFRVVASPVQSS